MKKLNYILSAISLLTMAAVAMPAQTPDASLTYAEADTLVLEESIVIGMGRQKRNTVTAAVSTIDSRTVSARPVSDLTNALQGNAAGFNIVTDATSDGTGGEPGAPVRFTIRGQGSINGGEPYVLVDGIEQSLSNVSTADIESITILKDASASSVYGARAAYGVVIVTTKSGAEGKASVNITAPLDSALRSACLRSCLLWISRDI